MVQYSKLITTTKGQALMAKMIGGTTGIEFTKVCASSTVYTESQLPNLTSLSNIKQTSLISKVTRTNNTAIKVETAFTNSELTSGYYMRTLGLYAVDPNEGEILYAVCVATDDNCYMPPNNGVTSTGAYIQMVQTVGNASSVSIDCSGATATIGDIQALEAEIADLKAFVGYTDSDIVGVEVDFKNKKFTRLAGAVGRTPGTGFDDIKAFGGRKRCDMMNDGTVVAYQGDAGFTNTGKLTQAIGDYSAGTIVQTMVEQPAFYYKVVPLMIEKVGKLYKIRKVRYYVSDTPKAGFKLHPDFIVNGVENKESYHSAFEGSLYDVSASTYILDDSQVADFSNDMLCSIANAKPMSGLTQNATRGNFRNIAEKRGTGWEQLTVQAASATQLLMLIEYASFNMQSAIGNGNCNKADDGQTNMSENTGATVSLGNKSGAIVNENGIQIVSYRGEENPYANIWKWVDGINVYNYGEGRIYVADHGFADNTNADPYVDTGINICTTSGYVSAFAYSESHDWLFLPAETSGDSNLPVGDNFWQNVASNQYTVASLGAGWAYGLFAGAFGWNLDAASSYRTRYFGGRLVFHKKVAA